MKILVQSSEGEFLLDCGKFCGILSDQIVGIEKFCDLFTVRYRGCEDLETLSALTVNS